MFLWLRMRGESEWQVYEEVAVAGGADLWELIWENLDRGRQFSRKNRWKFKIFFNLSKILRRLFQILPIHSHSPQKEIILRKQQRRKLDFLLGIIIKKRKIGSIKNTMILWHSSFPFQVHTTKFFSQFSSYPFFSHRKFWGKNHEKFEEKEEKLRKKKEKWKRKAKWKICFSAFPRLDKISETINENLCGNC